MSASEILQPLCQYVIPHPTAQKILLIQREDNTWTLPEIMLINEGDDYYDYYMFGMQIQHVVDFEVLNLYQAQCIFHDDLNQMRWVYVTDNIKNRYELPINGQWVSHAELNQVIFSEEHIQAIIERYFTEIETGIVPIERVPWAIQGWQAQAFRWIDAQLEQLNVALIRDIELVRVWCITALYRVPTTNGDLYFKAVPPTFAREIGTTRWLYQQMPEHTPEVVAFDESQHFLLMRDFEADVLREIKQGDDLSIYEIALTEFATIQRMTIGQEQTLLALGALDYRLEQLMPKFKAFLADDNFFGIDHRMPQTDIDAILAAIPTIQAHIERLIAMDLPTTILHSDFHTGNVAIRGNKAIIFDWTDASIGLPIFDFTTFAFDLNDIFKDQPDTIQHLREVYFRALSDDGDIAQWQDAFTSSRIISLVMQCANYHHLLRTAEPNERWVLNFLPQLIKGILNELKPDKTV